MRYTEFKNNLTNNIYRNYLDGRIGIGRAQIANIYKQGEKNPRATFMQIYSATKEMKKIFQKQQNGFYLANQPEKIQSSELSFFKFLADIFCPEHQLIASAKDAMHNAMLNLYPSKKSQKFSKFIMLKQNFPILKNMKFIANFL